MKNFEICSTCRLRYVCSPQLIPVIEGKVFHPVNCRHFTCPEGRGCARIAIYMHYQRREEGIYVLFASEHKPEPTRRVNVITGAIESFQDGEWYPTGQRIL